MPKSWKEKYETRREAEIEKVEKNFADIPAGASMLIATPAIVDEYVRQIPKGRSSNLKTMRSDLAAEYHAEYTCPVTSGIFLRIVAEKAFEEYQQGKALKNITPFWRIMDEKSTTARKLSFGTDFIREQRAREHISE